MTANTAAETATLWLTNHICFLSTQSRFFAQSKYASFQRQLNLYGFTRASIPYLQEGKTRNYSYYSHPYFIRGDLSRLHQMVRCKIKGNGKKRCPDDNDDHPYNSDYVGCGSTFHKNSGASYNEEFNVKQPVPKKNQIPMSFSEFNSPSMESKDALSDLEDGDLLFFDGIPFHFLSPELDVTSLRDTTSAPFSDSDIDLLPLMLLPPSVSSLDSGVDLLKTGDDVEANVKSTSHHAVSRHYPRSIVLDEKYETYRNSLEALHNSSSKAELDRPQSNDSTILGVFDHHFYDIHSPGTMSMSRYNDFTIKPIVATSAPNVPLMDSWTYFRREKTNVTTK